MRISTLGLSLLAGLGACSCSTSTVTQARDNQSGGQAGSAGEGGTSTQGSTHQTSTDTASGGTAQSGGSASSTSAQGGTAALSTELTCSSYCALVQANCNTDTTRQYKSDISCMNSCAAFRLGTNKDSSGNTLGCRAHYAALAATNTTANCPAAGPAGIGTCGSNCDGYCSLMTTLCGSVYEDETVCHNACVLMTGVDNATYLSGGSGDNLQCRIYHATFAAEGFPTVHCPHASPTPLSPCAG